MKTSKELANELCNALDEKRILEPDQLTVEAAAVRLVAQEARIAELTKDAERYRWLRNQHDIHDPLARVVWWNQPTGMLTFTWIETVNSKNLDESIDAAKEQV